jgi:hypothetical protein
MWKAGLSLMQAKSGRADLNKRYAFVCPMSLNKTFEFIPPEVKDRCLLIFRCTRSRLFPSMADQHATVLPRVDCAYGMKYEQQENLERQRKPWQGGSLHPEVAHWILEKDRQGQVYWFKPECDLKKLSAFIESFIDPMTNWKYAPLIMDPKWWRTQFRPSAAKYVHNPNVVIANMNHVEEKIHELDLGVLQELIYQSNQTLEPCTKWPYALSMRWTPRYTSTSMEHNHVLDAPVPKGSTAGVKLIEEVTRVNAWPGQTSVRLDNLHLRWQHEESVSARHGAHMNLTKSL